MSPTPLYHLRFEPFYQYRLGGGRRLAGLLTAPLPGDGPIGEAWVLSDGGAAVRLAYFTPKPGDAVFLPAGTAHSTGGDIVVFEVQENSDLPDFLPPRGVADPPEGKA